MEKYGPFFQPGSAFVLKNVIVIATERNSYMIVTLNNLVKLYKVSCPCQTPNFVSKKVQIFQASDGTASAEICRLTKEDIERSTRAVEEAEKRMRFAAKPPSQTSGSGAPRGQFSFNVTTFPGSMQGNRFNYFPKESSQGLSDLLQRRCIFASKKFAIAKLV